MAFFSFRNKLFAVPFRYGLLGGAVVLMLFLVFYFLELDPLVNIKMIDLLILAIFIFFAVKEFRDQHNHRNLHFWQGMSAGVVTYVTIAVISSIFILLMTVMIDPEMTTNYIEGRIQLLNENKPTLVEAMDEKTFLEAVAGVEKTTPVDLAIDDFIKKSVIGLFLTIIIAVILRK